MKYVAGQKLLCKDATVVTVQKQRRQGSYFYCLLNCNNARTFSPVVDVENPLIYTLIPEEKLRVYKLLYKHGDTI